MRIDLFCKVVDNYGDAGFCFRLARRLTELLPTFHHFTSSSPRIRLFCDKPELIQLFAGSPLLSQMQLLGFELLLWQEAEQLITRTPYPDVVLETFSCELPRAYTDLLIKPLIINIEYLSAQTWTHSVHGLASLPSHSQSIKRYFFYPGFNEQTGGILGQFQENLSSNEQKLSFKAFARENTTRISIFNYGGKSFIEFVNQVQESSQPVDLFICHGKPQEAISDYLGSPFIQPVSLGQLKLIPTPFITQDEYDALLSFCDLNWVRGEDSFLRAQWAAKPFIWDIYPQEENIQQEKFNAFLDIYLHNTQAPLREALTRMMQKHPVSQWWDQLELMAIHARNWKNQLLQEQIQGDLGQRLMEFIRPFMK